PLLALGFSTGPIFLQICRPILSAILLFRHFMLGGFALALSLGGHRGRDALLTHLLVLILVSLGTGLHTRWGARLHHPVFRGAQPCLTSARTSRRSWFARSLSRT